MHALRTAILQHTTPTGVHHDWLIEDPTLLDPKAQNARLWTARVTPPPQDWPRIKRFELTAIAPHRRAYLTYQGEVSDNRGRVKRLASGTCFVKLWSEKRIVLTMQTQSATLEMQLQRHSDERWLVVLA